MYVKKQFDSYKLKIDDGSIFDPIRNKYVKLTPEEIVRQQTVQFLIKKMRVPKDKICVEIGLSSLISTFSRKRIDICIFHEKPIAIVECKANYIGYSDAAYIQAIDYVEELGLKCYFVSDGIELIGYFYNSARQQYEPMETIPSYAQLISLAE